MRLTRLRVEGEKRQGQKISPQVHGALSGQGDGEGLAKGSKGRPLDMHVLAHLRAPNPCRPPASPPPQPLTFSGNGLSNMAPLPPVSCEHKLIQLRVLTVLDYIYSCLL